MNKFLKFGFHSAVLTIILVVFSSYSWIKLDNDVYNNKPKYIFLFIGDGMGSQHIALSEAYFSNISGNIGFESLCMTKFPIFGQCNTHCKNRQITDSGAAGSAIACGEKANVNSISYYENPINKDVESIAKIAHNKNLKVGIISTVCLNHATPAAFYAVNENRKNYYEIGLDLPKSNFEFFGGGGFYLKKNKANDKDSLLDIFKDNGYKLYTDYKKLNTELKDYKKLIYTNPVLVSEESMPYAIDRNNYGGVSLKEIVKIAINFLDNKDGFFMMVEGGKIDWCSHENDAATIIYEVKDFDNAIKEAYNFYLSHPDETLIIVTADHETAGVSMGTAINDYESNFSILSMQKCSQYHLNKEISEYKKSQTNYDLDYVKNIANNIFYSKALDFTQEENKQILLAFDYYFYKKTDLSKEELYKLYGGYNPIAVTFTKILNSRASVNFSSWSHTGAKVPVFSIGIGSEKFSGNMDNTDIKSKIMNIMNW